MGNNDVFAVIADKTRRGILAALKDGERPVGDLVAELGVSQPTVSKHLRILRDAGMVSMEAQGQRRLYAVRPEPLAEVTEWVHGVVGDAAGSLVPAEAGADAPREAELPEPAATVPVTTTGEPAIAVPEQDTEVPEPAPAVPVTTTGATAPAPPQDAAEDAVPIRQELVPLGADPEDTSQRTGRGAGARAVGLLSSLPGLRRRPRHRRR